MALSTLSVTFYKTKLGYSFSTLPIIGIEWTVDVNAEEDQVCSPPDDIHVLVTKTCAYVGFHGIREFKDVGRIKGDNPGLSR
jgi:hypothetical protein